MNSDQAPLVSIIVPCYNYGRFLKESLDSVLTQAYNRWECIIVDNGSTDNTSEVADLFVKQDPRFIYRYTGQKGVSYARNLGVQLSKGEYILPLDADDRIHAAYLEKAVPVLQSNRQVKVVYCDAQLFGAASGRWTLPAYSLKDLLIENAIFCTALFRRTDFESTGGYNEAMKEGFEDWDFWISMLKTGGDVYKIPETLFYYRIRSESRNSKLDLDKQLRLRRQIVENHRELYQHLFALPDLIFENYLVTRDLAALERSLELRIGRLIMKPLRWMITLFKGKSA